MKKFMHSAEKSNWVRRITAVVLAATVALQQGAIVTASESEIVPVTETSQAEDPSAAAAGESEVKNQAAVQQEASSSAVPVAAAEEEASQAEPAKETENTQVVSGAQAAQSGSDIIEDTAGSAISSSDASDTPDTSIKDGIIAESEKGDQSAPAESETEVQKVDTLSTSNQGDSINASIKAINGNVLPSDAVLSAAELNPASQADLSIINDSLAKANDVYNTHNITAADAYLLDLSLKDKDGNVVIQPDGPVEVTVTFPADVMAQYEGQISSYKIYHIAQAGGVVKAIDTNAHITLGNENTVSKATYTVDSFSPFVLVPEKSQFDKYMDEEASSLISISETEIKPDSEPVTKAETEPETTPETIPEAKPETRPVTTTEIGTEASSGSKFESGLTKQSETETEKATESESVVTETETETEDDAECESDKTETISGDDYEIKVHFTAASKVPVGSSVKAREITDEAATSEFLDKAEKAVDFADSADRKVTGRFFDITIVDPEGKEVEPAGPVDVTITCKSDVADNLRSDPKVVHFEDNQNTKVPEEVSVDKTTSKNGTDTVKFQAESFSVYGVVYTVDFTFQGFTYNMSGNTSMQLSDLMAKLDVDGFDVSKVENVSFTDESLVKIEKNKDGDYTLTSLQPFSSDEMLTVEMSDGVVYQIGVTDDVDLGQYITGFSSYKGSTDQNGNTKWDKSTTFNDGDSAKFTINYSIPKGALKSGDSLTYDLGDHVTLPGNGESGDVKQGDTVVGTYSITKDGKITITLNDQFESTEAFTGDLTFEGTVHNDSTENNATVNFGGAGSVTINPKPKDTELTIKKIAQKQTDGTIKYTILVGTTKGTNGDIVLDDWLSGLGFDKSQISGWKVTYNGGNTAPDHSTNLSTKTPTYTENGWTLTLPEIPKTAYGQYKIEYTLDPTNIKSDEDGKEVISNTARAADKSQNPSDTTETVYRKSFVEKSVSPDWTNRKLKWTITVVNNDPRNHNVTDLMNCPETALFSCPSTAQYRVQESAVLTGRVILPVFSATPDNHLLH